MSERVMTDEEIRKDIDARIEKAFPCDGPKSLRCDRCSGDSHTENCPANYHKQARDVLIEYRKVVLEEGDECAALLSRLLYYREHDKVCEVGKTEFCTCGLKQVADDARKLLRIRALAVPKGVSFP